MIAERYLKKKEWLIRQILYIHLWLKGIQNSFLLPKSRPAPYGLSQWTAYRVLGYRFVSTDPQVLAQVINRLISWVFKEIKSYWSFAKNVLLAWLPLLRSYSSMRLSGVSGVFSSLILMIYNELSWLQSSLVIPGSCRNWRSWRSYPRLVLIAINHNFRRSHFKSLIRQYP